MTSSVVLAAIAVTGLIAAARPPVAVKGVNYRVRVQTQMPNMGGGGGGDAGGGGFPGGFGGFGQSQLVRVDLAGNRAKVEFQIGNPPGSSLNDYYLMILDSNKVYRISSDSQTFTDAVLAAGMGGRGGPGGGGGDRAAAGGRGGRGGGAGGDQGRRGRGGGGLNPMTVLQDLVITGMRTTRAELGAGDPIEARPTKHYRITVDYDFKLYGQPRQAKTTTEIWAVDFPQKIVDPFASAATMGDSLSYAGIASRLVAETRKVPGTHVKVVTTQTIPIAAMMAGAEADVSATGVVAQSATIVRTTTITALKEVDLDET
ncbi:MAG: hypothetical protein ABIR92_04040, partial [Gemmatimonadaceae bacterium]